MSKTNQPRTNPVNKLSKSVALSLKGGSPTIGIMLTALITLLSAPLYIMLLGLFAYMADPDVSKPKVGNDLIFIFYILLIVGSALMAGALGSLCGKFERKGCAFLTLSLLSFLSGVGLMSVFIVIGGTARWLRH